MKLLTFIVVFFSITSLSGCDSDEDTVTVPYLNRDVVEGEAFTPIEFAPQGRPQIVGRDMPVAEFETIPNGITDIDMLRLRDHVFTRDARQDEIVTLDMLAPHQDG